MPLPSEQSMELEHRQKEPPQPLKTARAAPSPLALRGPIPSPKVRKTESPSHLYRVGRNAIALGAS
jgi:hypothetical protein